MKSLVGVYASHDDAIKALDNLKQSGFPMKFVSLIAKAEVKDNHIHLRSSNLVEKIELGIGTAAGAILGLLTGVGIFSIPGFGIFYAAGAAMGIFSGMEIGVVGSSVIALITGISDESNISALEKHLNDGKYLILIEGDDEMIKRGEKILGTLKLHLEYSTY
jgi:hypothetical protein